jgi:membrane peptidoglycan carboxypeptidase
MLLSFRASFRRPRYFSAIATTLLIAGLALTVFGASQRKSKPAAKPSPASTRSQAATSRERANARGQAATRDHGAANRTSANNAPDRRNRNSEPPAKKNQPTDKRQLLRRQRDQEARRQAEARRREAAEAERRRRAAIAAAEAHRRSVDQSLRDETVANIRRDDTSGEDPEVRRIAVEALGNRAGSVVVMDPRSGRVYAVINQDWALRQGYKPCSTIKLVTGMAGLSERVINPTDTINIADRSYRLDLTDSLAFSNNGYFQNVGGQVGFERMVRYARELGLGEATGINKPNESAGRVPLFKSGYAVNHMSSHGDDFEVTPIQLATLVSAMANGGNLLAPRLPRSQAESFSFNPIVRRHIGVPADAVQRMTPGMIGAVNYGTAKLAFDPLQTIAGKTGSCIGQGSWLGLFASYAPVSDPRLAVVVVTRGSGERGKYAAAVAGRIYRALDSRFAPEGRTPVAQSRPALNPQPRIDPNTAAALSDEESEDEAADAAELATERANTAREANQTRLKQTVITAPAPRPVSKPAPLPPAKPVETNNRQVVTLPIPGTRPRIVPTDQLH